MTVKRPGGMSKFTFPGPSIPAPIPFVKKIKLFYELEDMKS